MDKILVTGCCGFIGSHLCEKLLEDYKVVGVDNFLLGTKENIKTILGHKNFIFHPTDILNHNDFENIFRIHSFKAVFHLAANSDISNPDPKKDFQHTLSTTLCVLEKCRIRGIKEFVFTSSGAVYGEAHERVNESYCGLPISHYAAAKVSSEAFISSYCSLYDIRSFILRFPNVIGERMTHGAIFDFANQLKRSKNLKVLGDGNQRKPYMYVKDLISAMLFVWKNARERVNIYNISGIGDTSIKEIAEKMCSGEITYGKEDRGWPGDVPQYKCDTTRLKELGWFSKKTSNEAVDITIKFYEADKSK